MKLSPKKGNFGLREQYLMIHELKKRGMTDNDYYKNLLFLVRCFNNHKQEIKYTYFNSNVDGYIEKITFPADWTPSKARQFFALRDYIPHPKPSMYDCTGRQWTRRFRTTTLHGQVVIYHYVDIDL